MPQATRAMVSRISLRRVAEAVVAEAVVAEAVAAEAGVEVLAGNNGKRRMYRDIRLSIFHGIVVEAYRFANLKNDGMLKLISMMIRLRIVSFFE